MRVLERPTGDCMHLFAGSHPAGLAGEYKDIKVTPKKKKTKRSECLGYVPLHGMQNASMHTDCL